LRALLLDDHPEGLLLIDLANLIAVVTGGAGGIGAAIGRALATAGATVIGVDIHPTAAAPAVDEQPLALSARYLDVTVQADWEALAEEIERDHGRLDILVHNAGILVTKPIEQTTIEDWRRMMSVNAEALLLGTQALLPLLRKGGEARRAGAAMITISSTASRAGAPLHVGYCASKAASQMFAKACAVEFSARRFNIRSVSVHPGGTDTAMIGEIGERMATAGLASSPAEARAGIEDAIPIGRLAHPEDIADAVTFLASDAAAYIHGTELFVDGGVTAS